MVLASFPVVGHVVNQSGPGIVRPGRDLSTSRQNLLATYNPLIYHISLRVQEAISGLADRFERPAGPLYVWGRAHRLEIAQRKRKVGLGSIRVSPRLSQRGQFG